MGSIAEAYIASRWPPLILQASEEEFHWAIIPAISTPTHTLSDPIAPQTLPELPACKVAALIAVEHHPGRLAANFPRHFQRFDRQSAIR